MSLNLRRVQDADVKNKTVILRLDLDVPEVPQLSPISNTKIISNFDFTRLQASIETINYLLKQKSKIVIIGHRGRPDGEESKYSVEKVIPWFIHNFGGEKKKIKLGNFEGWEINENIVLIENLRFYEGEEENDKSFALSLACLGQVYVNDAFASIHRNHASVVGIAKVLPSYAGLHLQKEVRVLSQVLLKPERPLSIVIGGAKIETKLPLVEKMHQVADSVLVGGEIAEETKTLLKVGHQKSVRNSILLIADLNRQGEDITPVSFANFSNILLQAKTIIWNGPMGKISTTQNRTLPSEVGTLELAKLISKSTAYTIVGGGDTVSFLSKHNLLNKFDFVSVGGGAMLEFLSGDKMPGLTVLES